MERLPSDVSGQGTPPSIAERNDAPLARWTGLVQVARPPPAPVSTAARTARAAARTLADLEGIDERIEAVAEELVDLGHDATEFRARLFAQGLTPVGNTPDAFAKAIRAETEHWRKVVQARRLAAE